MREIDKIRLDGFSLPREGGRIEDLAFFSLKIALEAYFCTYQPMRYNIHDVPVKPGDQDIMDFNCRSKYFELCQETIVHFQHFIELVFKDMLRRKHLLLANFAANKHLILYKIIMGEEVEKEEIEKLNSIEFNEALERICALIDAGKIDNGKKKFIVDAKKWLAVLNNLRNRVWHRGTFILRYHALDELVGGYILPFVQIVLSQDEYRGMDAVWKYNKLHCGVDPLTAIINELNIEPFNVKKVAFLKELGRAAYENPVNPDWNIHRNPNMRAKSHAEQAAKIEEIGPEGFEIKICPVCGINSLVTYREFDYNNPDPEQATESYYYVSRVKCTCCTFNVWNDLENPSSYNLPIEDYWQRGDA